MKIGLAAILLLGLILIKIIIDTKTQTIEAILGFPILITLIYLRIRYQRRQIFTPNVKSHLEGIGFEITSERPLDFTESIKYGVKISPGDVNGISIDFFRYQSVNQRIFKVIKLDSKNEYELCCEIITRWNNSIYFEVLDKTRLNW